MAIVPEFDGLKPSAVADALTVSGLRFHMREKNAGRFVAFTTTLTVGLMAKLAELLPFGKVTSTPSEKL